MKQWMRDAITEYITARVGAAGLECSHEDLSKKVSNYVFHRYDQQPKRWRDRKEAEVLGNILDARATLCL